MVANKDKDCGKCRDANVTTLRMIQGIVGRDDILLISTPGHVQELADLALEFVPFSRLPLAQQLRWIMKHCEKKKGAEVCPNRYSKCVDGDGRFMPMSQHGGCYGARESFPIMGVRQYA
jgi:hypothetical protein